MASNGQVRFERKGALVEVTIDHPDRNLILGPMFDQLSTGIEALARDEEVAVLVLRGVGADFSHGRDPHEPLGPPETAMQYRKALGTITRANAALQSFPGISLAVVQGAALGAACSIVARCDLAIAGSSARLGFPEINGGGAPAIVIDYVGKALQRKVAMDLVVTGREIDAEEARQIGLVNRVVPDAELDAAAQQYVDELLSKSHRALRTCKAFFNQLPNMQGTVGAEYAITLLAAGRASR